MWRSGGHSGAGELITCSDTENLAGGSTNESDRSSAAAPEGVGVGSRGSEGVQSQVSHGRLLHLQIKRRTCHPPPPSSLLQSIIKSWRKFRASNRPITGVC